jgi:outer membrane protein assembly factor BamA
MNSEMPLEDKPGLLSAMSGFFFTASLPCLIAIFAVAPSLEASAQKRTYFDEALSGYGQDSLFTGTATRYAIDDIVFVGNSAFSSDLLAAVISSRPGESSVGRKIVAYILRQLRRNAASPPQILAVLAKLEKNFSGDVRYFDKLTAAADTSALAAYYRRNGFHRAQVEYAFIRNTETERNALVFQIIENEPTPIDTIAYYGLENLPDDAQSKLAAVKRLARGARFSQSAVTEQNEKILSVLRDNGYYQAQYRKPVVSFLPDENRDSITVVFSVGKRKRIERIAFIDSSASYTYLSPSVAQEFIEVKEGDWYNESAIVRSVSNLYNFGLFDLAVIDTSSVVAKPTDSTLALQVVTRTRRIHSSEFGAFIGQIANTSLLELGASARYENKNLFGWAQTFGLQAQLALVDVNTFVNNALSGNIVNARLEGLVGARFAYPLLTKLFGRRVDFDSRLSYSLQSLAFVSLSAPLLLETGKLYASFPVALPREELFNSFFAEINLDRQRPINFESTRRQALELARTPAEQTIVLQQLFQYETLDNLYRQTAGAPPFLTGAILTLGVRGDHRDNLFNPRSGYFLDFAADAAVPPGASEFIRLSADMRWYSASSPQSVFAAKFRAGHIFLMNPQRLFVPIERHFFAGGSNSVRGWNVRELRVSSPEAGAPNGIVSELAFVGQFIGSGSLVEASAEWRYNFTAEYNEYGSFWERQFSKLGVTAFIDIGNAFNSFLEPPETYATLPLEEIFPNIAVAAGVGIRYDTSVGPFRVDVAVPLYNPATKLFITQLASPSLQNILNVQIGLGYAF